MVANFQLCSRNKANFMPGAHHGIVRTVLKGHSIRKVEHHSASLTSQPFGILTPLVNIKTNLKELLYVGAENWPQVHSKSSTCF